MITDKHLFSELIYIGPKALVALKDAIRDFYGGVGYQDEHGRVYTSEEIFADHLIDLVGTKRLRIGVITQNGSRPSEEFVLHEQGLLGIQYVVDPAKREELIKRLRGRACIYATLVTSDEATSKGGAQ